VVTLRELQLGSAFRATWINSGVTPTSIQYRVLSGSETVVSTYAGQSSGNGHFYVDASVDSPGLWQSQWVAVIAANTYVSPEVLSVFPTDTNDPGRYCTWDEIVGRYKDFKDKGGASSVASRFIGLSEARIDSRLGSKFSTPFSDNNLTVKDLAIDMAYLLGVRLGKDEYERLRDDIDARIKGLLDGTMVMVTTSGDSLRDAGDTPAWSSTQDYHPSFNMLDETHWGPGSTELIEDLEARA
jgi:hypothetical protein